ncbi:oxidoreductase, partial [bacterium]|nr:oxidoreductase [bacterium]
SINHPYAVSSEDKPSLLPEKAIAVRFHSIGGWGAITTGKNLSEILGDLGTYIKERDFPGTDKEVVHISANPKYGSEKKGAPTNYFLVAAPERIRVNCDLQHVDVVLCCDPKAFTHTNPLIGLKEGGALVWENSENTPEIAWKRIPVAARKEIIEKKIKVYLLNGFMIAREATARTDLQLRMQGNSFLGAFFKVAAFLKENKIPDLEFLNIVEQQYKKKFGKLGAAVVESNMTVMREGFEQVKEMPYGDVEDGDLSLMQGEKILPLTKDDVKAVSAQCPMLSREKFNSEFRAGLGYFQPASPLASTGIITVGTGEQSSKFVSRRLVPKYSPQKCTQCMECVIACPDTALPCTVQEIKEVLKTAIENYVVNKDDRATLLTIAVKAEKDIRAEMLVEAKNKERAKLFVDIAIKYISTNAKNLKSAKSIIELENILKKLPFAYAQTPLIFAMKEKQNPGSGGLFSIFVQDLCKGCGHCVKQCKFDALEMVVETEELTADMHTAKAFMHKLPETLPQYMGLYNSEKPMDTRAAALKYLLMQRKNYQAMVCGDGACAGCGEKTVLRNLASITEAYMRPLFHAKADRLRVKADLISKKGLQALEKLEKTDPETYKIFKRTVLHTLMHYGGESLEDTKAIMQQFKGSNEEIIKTVIDILNQDAFNHKDLQAIEGKVGNGMCVMGMTASTGCNSVYSSTPPANPHTYPWVNSLFQDGSTIGWLMAESFIVDHARKSVMPERFADLILDSFNQKLTEEDYFNYTHFTDKFLTEQEIKELPKIWAIGGDGALGDIGFQNLSKTMLQNRPNYHCLMLDTQVYSNTGGQNSDSSVMPGGFDMNQYGAASQGKLTEKKEVAQIFTVGHGSPYVAQVSMANSATFFRAVMESLDYRGAAFIQAYTPCMPEHAIGDDTASKQSKLAKDSRGMVEFIYNSQKGETDAECLDVNGNANVDRDWVQKVNKISKEKYNFTVFHWAVTEGRFRNHVKKAPVNYKEDGVYLDDILNKVTQQDVISRNVFQKEHPAYIPDFHVYADVEQADGSMKPYVMSRQMVLFCIERRKNWRKLQARAGVVNQDYTV